MLKRIKFPDGGLMMITALWKKMVKRLPVCRKVKNNNYAVRIWKQHEYNQLCKLKEGTHTITETESRGRRR